MNRNTLRDRLEATPTGFDFFQAVRLLEAILPERAPVGGGASPDH